jgi:hypothetical protein
MIVDQHFSILIDLGATEIFISSVSFKRIKVKAVEQDEFRRVEMASVPNKMLEENLRIVTLTWVTL